jgi:hypothetical protein
MRMDVRLPIGLLFVVLGGLLAGYGLVVGSPSAEHKAGLFNLNLWWGLLMLAFGLGMLLLAWWGGRHPRRVR